MKKKRHSMILKLIEMYSIGTQEEMLEKLEENGFSSTQATVSRDIKELRLVKQMDKNGVYRYVEGKSYVEISEEMGRHVKSIDNALQRIKRKLLKYLEQK